MPPTVIVLAVIAFFVAVGFGVVVPVLPVFARSFHVGQLETGLVVSAFALVRLVTGPFTGPLISRLGERTVLSVGVLVVAGSSAAMGLAGSYPELLVWRAAGGLGSSMFTVSAMTLLIRTVDAGRRGRAAALYQTGFLIGNMAGPAVGGLLAAVSLRAPFFFYAGTLVAAALVGWVFLRDTSAPGPAADAPVATPFRRVLADVRYQAALACSFANGWSSLGVRSSLIPVLVVEVLHRDTVFTGVAMAAASVVQTLVIGPSGTLVDRYGRRPAMIAGSLVGAAALTGIALVPRASGPVPPATWVVILLCVYAVAVALMGTAPAATVGDVAPGRSGSAVAAFSMASDAGQILGPIAAGAIADHLGVPAGFASGAVLMVVAALASARMPRASTPRPRPPRTTDDGAPQPG